MPDEDLLTIDQVAELLQVKKATVYAWTHQGWIPHVKVGRRLVRFRREAIEAWLKAQEVEGRLTRVPAVEVMGLQDGNGRRPRR